MAEVMRKNGYAPSTVKKPGRVIASKDFQEAIDPVVAKMMKIREIAMKRMEDTASKASFRDVTDSMDKLTKNIQLLSGKSTENVNAKVIYLPQRDNQ